MDMITYNTGKAPLSMGLHHPRLNIYPALTGEDVTSFATFEPALELVRKVLNAQPDWTAIMFPWAPAFRGHNRLIVQFFYSGMVLGQGAVAVNKPGRQHEYSLISRRGNPYLCEFKSVFGEKGFKGVPSASVGILKACSKVAKIPLILSVSDELSKAEKVARYAYGTLEGDLKNQLGRVSPVGGLLGGLSVLQKTEILRCLPQLIEQLDIVSPTLDREIADCIAHVDIRLKQRKVLAPILNRDLNPMRVMRAGGKYYCVSFGDQKCEYEFSEVPSWITVAVETLHMSPMSQEFPLMRSDSTREAAIVEDVGMAFHMPESRFVDAKFFLLLHP